MQQHQEGIGQEYHPNIISLMQTEQSDKKRKPRILLVDDDMAALQALSRTFMLRMSDVDVDTSSSALDALAQLQSREYDVVVSDIKMPMMDGIQLLSNIHERMPNIPVLLITGHGEHELAMQALQEGAFDYTLKPIDRDFFVASVRRALQSRQLFRLVQEKQHAIEEQKRTEQQLKESEENFRVLAEMVPQFVWVARSNGRVDYCNQRRQDYLGLTLEQLQSDCCAYLQAVHPEDRESSRAHWLHALDTGDMFEHEQRMRQGMTGDYRWFLARALPVRDEAGQIVKWFGTCTNIEEQKRAEQQLKASQESWRVLAETLPHLVWAVRSDGRLEYANQQVSTYLGAFPDSFLGDEWRQFVHPDDYARLEAARRHALETGDPYEGEYRLKEHQTGRYRWFLGRIMPVRNETGMIVKRIGTATDIDEQKQTEEALRQSQKRVNVLMNSNIIGITLSKGEQIVEANDAFLRMTGYTHEDLHAGRINWMQMTPPDYLARTIEARQELDTQQSTVPYEKEYVCQDGSRLPVLVGLVALPHHPSQTVGFVLDNSAHKELEQRKDNFISLAGHELRNPLAALKLQSQMVRRRLEKRSLHEAATELSRVEMPIKQLERLIGELLDLSKIQAGRLEYIREPVDLDELIQEVADTMQQMYPSHRILVRGAVQASLSGDRDRLGQVFTNLLCNAIKYSPGAETVEMDLSTSDEAVTVRVHDHGLGIPREQRDKIFERFYRVCGSRQRGIPGLGIGLSVVAEIVKHHGGTITVDSEVGTGSTFTVTLPTRREA